jgi:uncharacterized protein YbjT (DUF2867 family)
MILVTGVTGRSGAIVIREFARQGLSVRGLVRNRAKARAMGLDALPSVELVKGDMLRAETLHAAFKDVDRVLMISGARQQMVRTQCLFIDAAKAAGIGHIIKLSGAESGVGFNAQAFSGTRNHEDIEHYLKMSGLSWTMLRPSQFMQTYLVEPPAVASNKALMRPMGAAKVSPIDIEDIAKIAVALVRQGGHAGRSYDMTGPEALSMYDVAERISEALGERIPYLNIAQERYRNALDQSGAPAAFADLLEDIYAERRKHLKSRVELGAHEAFGVHPTPFLEFARRHVAAFQSAGSTEEQVA